MNAANHALEAVVAQAVVSAVAKSSIDAKASSAKPIADAVTKAVGPAIMHATNNESPLQSRVTIGAVVQMFITLLGVFGIATDWIDPDAAVLVIMALGSAWGGFYTLYGRWKAKKPIGE